MSVSYKKLFNILKERNITKITLKEGADLSSATLAKLSKNEQISMSTLISICEYLNCQPGDIMECVTDYTKPDEYGNINYTKKVADREHDDYEEIEMIAKDPYHRDD